MRKRCLGFISIIIILIIFCTTTVPSKATGEYGGYGGFGGETIDASTFGSDYRITTIHIGSNVNKISSSAFRNLINLRAITVSSNNPSYASYSGCLYDKDFTELLCFPANLSGAYIPESVVSIGKYALYGVPDKLKKSIVDVVESQASENGTDMDFPGAHFVHVDNLVKWRCADGTVIVPNSDLMAMCASVVNDCTTYNMKRSNQLENCFYYTAEILSYERSMDTPSGDWTREYAEKALLTGRTNCYGYAAAFAYIASGLGYEARVCTGTVTSSLGGRTAHAWTEVKVGSRWYVFDAEMQDAKGDGYYKQTYDSYPAGPLETEMIYKVSF